MARSYLTPDEVTAMFTGRALAADPTKPKPYAAREKWPRFFACDNCGVADAPLMAFRGDECWQSLVGLDDPLRAEIRTLRVQCGQGTISLCDACITELQRGAYERRGLLEPTPGDGPDKE